MASSTNALTAAVPFEQIAWQISVDGQAIRRILSLKLEQAFGVHHSFELRLYHTEIEDPRAYRIDKSKELLGKTITVILGTQLNADINRFGGVITEVGFEEANGIYGIVILKGYSPTILLESGPNMRSFYNRNLSGIAGDIAGTVKGKLDVAIKPRFGGNIEYSVQHKESHFAFLSRLSAAYGEWFYYDGEKLNFGRPSTQPTFDLQYVRHLQNLKMNLQVVPMSFTHLSYRAVDDQKLQKDAAPRVDGLDYYGDLAVQKSAQVYSSVKNIPWQHANDAGALDAAARVNKSAAAAETFAITAESRHPAPRPGARIRILFGDTELGEYVVTEAVHNLDNVNIYSCVFKALPADIEVMPVPATLVVPQSGAQLATVVENADPAGIGRVRVQFGWQEEDSKTPWLRVLTPDAGSSGAVSKNRGFVFVPEIGDSVLVDFEQGNPDAPFVLGSVFHGKNGSLQGGSDDTLKTISTKSGNTITFNDAEGSVTVEDAGGSVYHMDGQGNVELTAPKTVTINGTDIHLNAAASISLTAGTNLLANAMVQMLMTTPHLQQMVADYFHTVAGKTLMTSHDGEIKLEAKQLIASGEERMFLHSENEVVANSKGTVELRGEEGNSHINTAETHEVERLPITAKCMVKFRPADRWAGEYGFDWLHEGDTGRRGDQWFGSTMGKHYVGGHVQPDGNSYNGAFRADLRMYDRKLRSYQCMTIGWKRIRNQAYLYATPVMTLMPGRTATLTLKIDIEEVPQRLTLEWEDRAATAALQANLTEIGDVRQGRYDKHNYLTIRCTQAFNRAHTLQVKADGRVCGAIRILPNAGTAVRHINVVFVSVVTNINGAAQIGRPGADDTPFFRQSMNQALVDPNLTGPVRVDARGSGTNHEFRRRFCIRNAAGRYTIDPNADASALRTYLEGLLERQHPGTYSRHYRMFFVGEQWPGLNGFSFFNSLFGVYFPSHQKATVAHETFHAMNVPHTFDGVDAAARFTYKGKSTDNIMDYSHHDGIERVSLFRWQWKLLNPNIR